MSGVISFSFPLSDQPVLGTWTIFADVQQQSYNATFEIQKYGKTTVSVQKRFAFLQLEEIHHIV